MPRIRFISERVDFDHCTRLTVVLGDWPKVTPKTWRTFEDFPDYFNKLQIASRLQKLAITIKEKLCI